MVFDEKRRQVVVGLIDYLHQFDLLKKMESTSKASLTFRNPTIVSPPSYRTRFVNAMHRYLVGIELELELRMGHRPGDSKSTLSTTSTTTTTTAITTSNDAPKETRSSIVGEFREWKLKVPQLKAKRAFSDTEQRTRLLDHPHSGHHHAHSDGESRGSDSSDENCFHGPPSPPIIRPLMPEDDHPR
jgi:hypothetical protein